MCRSVYTFRERKSGSPSEHCPHVKRCTVGGAAIPPIPSSWNNVTNTKWNRKSEKSLFIWFQFCRVTLEGSVVR